MGKENRVSKEDARLHDAAMRVGRQLSEMDLEDRGKYGTAEEQETNALNNFDAVFKAIKDRVTKGRRDIEGIERSARKSYAIRKNEKRRLRGEKNTGTTKDTAQN